MTDNVEPQEIDQEQPDAKASGVPVPPVIPNQPAPILVWPTDRPATGYTPRVRTRVLEIYPEAWEEGDEPVRVTVRANLTFAEINALPSDFATTFQEIFVSISPYVVAWNVNGRNSQTGAFEPIPVPSEAGWEVFRAVEPEIAIEIMRGLKQVHVGDGGAERKNSSAGSVPTRKPGVNGNSDVAVLAKSRNRPKNS